MKNREYQEYNLIHARDTVYDLQRSLRINQEKINKAIENRDFETFEKVSKEVTQILKWLGMQEWRVAYLEEELKEELND